MALLFLVTCLPAFAAAIPTGDYVVIRSGASLENLSRTWRVQAELPNSAGWTARVVRDDGATLQVSPTGDGCAEVANYVAGADGLVFLVKRGDLVPVLTQTVVGSDADGDTWTLQPGLPIPAHDATSARIQVSWERFAELPVDPSAIGWSVPSIPAPTSGKTMLGVAAGTYGTFHGAPLLELPGGKNPLFGSSGDDGRVTWRARCAALTFRPAAPITSNNGIGGLIGRPGSGAATRHTLIPGGTPLTWPDGTDAGRSGFLFSSTSFVFGGRVCLPTPLVPAGPTPALFCAPAAAVQGHRPASTPAPSALHVNADGFEATGGPTTAGVLTAFHASKEALAECYAKRVAALPFLGGDISLSASVDAQGQVTAVEVMRQSVGDVALLDCTMDAAGRMHLSAGAPGSALWVVHFTQESGS